MLPRILLFVVVCLKCREEGKKQKVVSSKHTPANSAMGSSASEGFGFHTVHTQ